MMERSLNRGTTIGRICAEAMIHHTTDTTSRVAWALENYANDVERIAFAQSLVHDYPGMAEAKHLQSVAIDNAAFWRNMALEEAAK